jgi:hypothetical protein
MRFEIVTSGGRGVHLASPGQSQALCMRPVGGRTGREGGASSPYLCQACARSLGDLAKAGKSR